LIGSILLLAYVTAARLVELWMARRNTAALIAAGGVEHAPGHYPLIVAMHTAWIAGLWWLAWDRPINPLWLAAFVLLQALRFWVLATLGRRFTTRIITQPGESLVKRGPYRFLRHPNYVVVIGEIAVLPLTFGLWAFALAFSLLNAVALTVRIRAENRALADLRHG
jgi:methyltransferase